MDIRTILLITGISNLMQLLVLTQQYFANKNVAGPGWWLMWCATEVIGFIMILMRSIPSILPLIIIFQNIVLFSGPVFLFVGATRFFDKKVNLRFILPFVIIYAVLHISFYFIRDDVTMRTLIFCFFISVIAFITAIVIYKNKTPSIAAAAYFNITIFLVHGVIFAYRTIMIILGAPVTDMFSPTLFNYLLYFDALIVGLLWTFGLIIMLNQRLNSEVIEVKNHFEKIFNTSPDAAVITRLTDGLFIDCNESYTKISGYTKEDVAGKSSVDINIWKEPADRDIIVRIILDKGSFDNHELLFRRKDGELITGLMSARMIKLKGVPHLLSVTRDISDRKRADEIIRQKNEELLKLNAEKDKFYSIIAHDLRSPFNSFLGLTQLMEEQLPEIPMEKLRRIATQLKNSALNLFRLLENLLNWSSIRQGLTPFTPAVIPLNDVVKEGIASSREPANIKGIEITCHIPEDMMVCADNSILQAVIRNLVSNAVKFTKKNGKIDIHAVSREDKSVEISIHDTGIGMNRSMTENLFRLDVQNNRPGTDGETSTGLGLLLCKEFVEKHGGKIWAESEEGKGSVFHFTIPCR